LRCVPALLPQLYFHFAPPHDCGPLGLVVGYLTAAAAAAESCQPGGHHKSTSFDYLKLLRDNGIEFDERFVLD